MRNYIFFALFVLGVMALRTLVNHSDITLKTLELESCEIQDQRTIHERGSSSLLPIGKMVAILPNGDRIYEEFLWQCPNEEPFWTKGREGKVTLCDNVRNIHRF